MTTWLLPGFNTDGTWAHWAQPALEKRGIDAQIFQRTGNRMGIVRDLIRIRRESIEAAAEFAEVVQPGDTAWPHSNGNRIVARALLYHNAPLAGAVYFAPALNRDFPLPPFEQAPHLKIVVYCTRHDWAVRAARWIPHSEWGDMGAWGAIGDVRYENVFKHKIIKGHSEWLADRERFLAYGIAGNQIIRGSRMSYDLGRDATGV